jgi:hypothetical protein
MPLGLSAHSLEQRRKYVMAGDTADLMAGNWKKVWRQKMGIDGDDDLSRVLAVQLGSMTEPLNLFWCERETGREVAYCTDNPLMAAIWQDLTGREALPEMMTSQDYEWLACNLDALSTTSKGHQCVLDAKHVGKADQAMIERYTPAMTHQATVMGTDWWALSVFIGNSKWLLVEQEVDPFYQGELIATTQEFWQYVVDGKEPKDRNVAAVPPEPQKPLRVVQLDEAFRDSFPNWGLEMATYMGDFAKTHAAATAHAVSRENIKGLLPEDVGLCTRDNVSVTRDRRGITISLKKEKP